jgi:hypothetical protein
MNTYDCRVDADSISPTGIRLTTMIVTFPRFILAEFNTHRVFSRNAASSRAIPTWKRIEAVKEHPFVPDPAANQPGMQAGRPLDEGDIADFRRQWLLARVYALASAESMTKLNVHKQWANRLLEPFSWVTVIVSSTDWKNFFAQRCHPDAQPEFQKIACMMRDALEASTPRPVDFGAWHVPMISDDDRAIYGQQYLRLMSAGRCARVSYLNHEGQSDPSADIKLAEKLLAAKPPHASPFEHQATPLAQQTRGNFRGWRQFRHVLGLTVEKSHEAT